MDLLEAKSHALKAHGEIVKLLNFFEAKRKIPNHDLYVLQKIGQRDNVIRKLKSESDEKEIHRLQGRLSQIDDEISFEDILKNQLSSIEKTLSDLNRKPENAR